MSGDNKSGNNDNTKVSGDNKSGNNDNTKVSGDDKNGKKDNTNVSVPVHLWEVLPDGDVTVCPRNL